MKPEDIIIAAADFTNSQVGTQLGQQAILDQLTLCREAIAKHLDADDRPGLFAPVMFERGGKELSGCILTLQDRAIFAWFTGVIRRKNFEVVVRYDTIQSVEPGTKSGNLIGKSREMLTVVAEETWTVLFPPGISGKGMDLTEFVRGALTGAIEFQHSDESSA